MRTVGDATALGGRPMPREEYDAIDAVNYSTLKEGRKSPLHYHHRVEVPTEDSNRLALGRATHTSVLEPHRFDAEFAVFTGERRSGPGWRDCVAANPGKTILKAAEFDVCLAMRDAVRSHPVAGPLLAPPGEAEKVVVWTDDATGIRCKGRLDWYRPDWWTDLKTTQSIERRQFGATAYRMGYHVQAAWYRMGLLANGLSAPPPTIVAVEVAAPHDVAVFTLDDDLLYAGELEVAELLAMVAAGRTSGRWPGRYPESVPLSLPRWAMTEEESAADILAGEDTP